ncbi:MAG: hypothetical protein RJB01_1773 [Actinomycetota bacterium]
MSDPGVEPARKTPSGALGLDAPLDWSQARYVAAQAAKPSLARTARLDEALGCTLAGNLVTLLDDPPYDIAAHDGYATCGEGPWRIIELAPEVALPSHFATPVVSGEPLPPHSDCVIEKDECVLGTSEVGDAIITARDPLTRLPEAHARPDLGHGIIRLAERGRAGMPVIYSGTSVTPAVIALAASLGHDRISIVPPPAIGTLVIGEHLLEQGPPRYGRPRDAVGPSITGLLGALGARAFPAKRASIREEAFIAEITDSTADLIVTVGATEPSAHSMLRRTLRDLAAHWLIDGITIDHGAETLLVRLPDGRLLLGLSGDPVSALAGAALIAPVLINRMRGDTSEESVRASLVHQQPLAAIPPLAAEEPTTRAIPIVGMRDGTFELLAPAHSLPSWARANAMALVEAEGCSAGVSTPVITFASA